MERKCEMSNKQRLSFLFGSGISSNDVIGIPTTESITNTIFSNTPVFRKNDGTYSFGSSNNEKCGTKEKEVPLVRDCLKFVKHLAEKYYENSHNFNYEDIYYTVTQIRDSITPEFKNPALYPTIIVAKEILEQRSDIIYDLGILFTETANYIHSLVWHKLSREPKNLDKLQLIKEACEDKDYSGLDIYTLNNDCVIEDYCKQNSIVYQDGFTKCLGEWNGSYIWSRDKLLTTNSKLRLFKLHGSVNWFNVINRDDSSELVIVKPKWALEHRYRIPGEEPRPPAISSLPLILIGTYNKYYDYTIKPFVDLQWLFYQNLFSYKTLFVSGYSFNDRAINLQLLYWMKGDSNRKLIIAHKKPDNLLLKAMPNIGKRIKQWRESMNRVVIIEKWFQEITWDELKKIYKEKQSRSGSD